MLTAFKYDIKSSFSYIEALIWIFCTYVIVPVCICYPHDLADEVRKYRVAVHIQYR
jgi:hypothetical protein